ncbi:hypothetical protein KAU11_07135, partial [Candidatus Babeliales bacterium]|nr:hypothetical protein [Candidatus Babeliales bacterium]
LNETGRGWISKTDWTKLGVITGKDLDNSDIGTDDNYVGCRFSNYTGTDKDPYLEITYTVPAVAEVVPEIIWF